MSSHILPAILFVCLGNICRSPLAEGVFRQQAGNAGLAVNVDSAGTGGWHIGSPPDPRAIAVAADNGIDIGRLAGRQVQPQDFFDFDYVIAMDTDNLKNLRQLRPLTATARLILGFDLVAGRQGDAVADPYYGDRAGFTQTFDDVALIAAALVQHLTNASRAVR